MALTLRQRVGQLLFVGLPSAEFDAETRLLLGEVQPGGIIYFAKNITSPAQVADLNARVRDALGIIPLISIDQEGGRVDRLKAICSPMPAAQLLRESEDASLSYLHGELTAETLRLLGFNMNFAPVLDLAVHQNADNALRERYFGESASQTVRLSGAYLEGLQNFGIIACGKHFPGLGDSSVDSHKLLPTVSRSRELLWAQDLVPYRDFFSKLNARLNVVMVAHAHYQALDQIPTPASISPNVVSRLLRNDMGFRGLAVTDDMLMGAITETMEYREAVIAAVIAGEDMVLVCNSTEKVYEAFEALASAAEQGRISESMLSEAIDHIAFIKAMLATPLKYNEPAYTRACEKIAELNAQLGRQAGER